MEKVKSVERAAIIKSRPSSEQKNGGPTVNSDGTAPVRARQQQATAPQSKVLQQDREDETPKSRRGERENESDEGGDLENQYFYEDEICCFNSKTGHIKFGLVIENYDESEEETTPEEDALKRGEIRACWHPEGFDEIIKQRKVGLVDRTLMPGDVVRRMVPGLDTQRGYCHEISVRADVRIIGTKYVVRNVASDRLRPLLSMPKDNAVCLDSWVGSTKQITEKLVLKSSCGSLVEICPVNDLCLLRDPNVRHRAGFFSETLFYPGQQLVGPMSELVNGKWLTTSNEMKYSRKNWTLERKFTVQSVELQGVTVHWQCKVASEELEKELENGGLQQPPDYVTGEDLKRLKKLNLFESCMLQINDKNYLKLEETDVICLKSAWRKEMTNKYRQLVQSVPEKYDNVTVTKPPEEQEPKETNGGRGVRSLNDASSKVHPGKLSVRSARKPEAVAESDEWETDGGEEEGNQSDGAASSCSAPTPKSSPKKCSPASKRHRRLRRKQAPVVDRFPVAGDEVVTEALVVYSTATVVWQDGTIETGISSTELRPIHHLDDHEFFPGDFVLAGNTDPAANPSFRDYGVIQQVDHRGRTARVKWFSTYTCSAEPQPTYSGETEVSVYDLKDHPDFQYRPGTIVIRVANFASEEDVGMPAAGQVVDNYTNGMVKVWWVDGRVSMCWPQDIFEVGQYDGENNFWGSIDSDNNSWETEDETSEFGDSAAPVQLVPKSMLAENLERARIAIGRLEEMFMINPFVQNQEIMHKLMLVYKKCRNLDRLMKTNFFHEEHFMGLVERVRRSNNQTTAERVQDQKNRLFNENPSQTTVGTPKTPTTPTTAAFDAMEHGGEWRQESTPKINRDSFFSPSPVSDGSVASARGKMSAAAASAIVATTPTGANDNDSLFNMQLDYVNVYMNVNDDLNNTSSVFDLVASDDGVQCVENDKANEKCVPAKLCSLLKTQLRKVLEVINMRYSMECALKEIVTIVEMQVPSSSLPVSPQAATPTSPEAPSEVTTPSAVEGSDAALPAVEPVPAERFQILDSAPTSHKYHLTVFQTSNAQSFYKAVQREHWLLRTGLPPGVWVRSFEDRLDLLSVMIEGPKRTPYEGGLFLFDVQLGLDYPRKPPLCHYISYCSDRLNPNLYEDGKVCVSLLGTWSGRGSELWSSTSTLLQVIVSIQGLILVAEPYFNEAGYEKLRGSQQGKENSRMYNEMVLLKLLQSMTKLMSNPPELFREEILAHFRTSGQAMHQRIKSWMEMSNDYQRRASTSDEKDAPGTIPAVSESESTGDTCASSGKVDSVTKAVDGDPVVEPDFPLIPASRGFCLTLIGLLDTFQKQLQQLPTAGQ